MNNESYIAITAHYVDNQFYLQSVLLDCKPFPHGSHTSQNLASAIGSVVNEWKLDKKVLLVVSDNAANIQSAIKDVLKLKHLGCTAHNLNLILNDALKHVSDLVAKVRTIVSHFRRSTKANEEFFAEQRKDGLEPKKLKLEIATRWNSTFYMLQRISELQKYVKTSFVLLNLEEKGIQNLSSEEWKIISDLCEILCPFEEFTNYISGEKYPTASAVIVMVNGLMQLCEVLDKKTELSSIVKTVLNSIKEGIQNQFKNIERSNTLSMCTFLDPRFKHVAFSSNDTIETVKANVKSALISKQAEMDRPNDSTNSKDSVCMDNQPSGSSSVQEMPHKKISFWDSFDRAAQQHAPTTSKESRAIVELQRYLQDELIPRKSDPLSWWRENAYQYPLLSKLAKDYFCAIATSVPCERVFSKSGYMISDRRNRLKGTKVKQLMFLNANLKH